LKVTILKKICLVGGKASGLMELVVPDIERIKIIKIDGNKVHLTGYQGGGGSGYGADEVYGRIANFIIYMASWSGWPMQGGIKNDTK
jgi:hypothetical protein